MGFQRGGAGGVQVRGFIDHCPGVLPRNAPVLQGGQRQREGGGQFVGLGQKRTGRPFADRQDARDLGGHCHVLRDEALWQGIRGGHRPRSVSEPGGGVDYEGSRGSLQSGSLREGVQPGVGLMPQRIRIPFTRRICARDHQSKRSNGSPNGLQRLHRGCPFHTHIILRGSDI
ncbi:hypothetical protein ASG77_00395 [Arthrobacter sp. Soil762]|nr:hypothetical protein ASG77_00395 [Arthrobacter sp. Soil762]